MTKGTFKFKPEATEAERSQVESQLLERGAKAVRPLFPDESDAELALMRVFEWDTAKAGSKALAFLQQSSLVEYAEGPTLRKLMH